MRCPQCAVFLGVKLKTAFRKRMTHGSVLPLDFRGVRVSTPNKAWIDDALRTVALQEGPSQAALAAGPVPLDGVVLQMVAPRDPQAVWLREDETEETVPVDQVYLGARYLRVLDAHRSEPVEGPLPLLWSHPRPKPTLMHPSPCTHPPHILPATDATHSRLTFRSARLLLGQSGLLSPSLVY